MLDLFGQMYGDLLGAGLCYCVAGSCHVADVIFKDSSSVNTYISSTERYFIQFPLA